MGVLSLLDPRVHMAGDDILVANSLGPDSAEDQVSEIFFLCDGECQAYVNTTASNKKSSGAARGGLSSEPSISLSSHHTNGSSSSEQHDFVEPIGAGTAVQSSKTSCFGSEVDTVTGIATMVNEQSQEDLLLSRRNLSARRTVSSFGAKENQSRLSCDTFLALYSASSTSYMAGLDTMFDAALTTTVVFMFSHNPS